MLFFDKIRAIRKESTRGKVMQFLQLLRSSFSARAASAEDRFEALVIAIADGDSRYEASEAMSIMTEAGKTPDDLEKAVSTLQRRREARKELDDAVTAEQEIERLDAESVSLRSEHEQTLKTLTQQFQELLNPKIMRISELRLVANRRSKATLYLESTCPKTPFPRQEELIRLRSERAKRLGDVSRAKAKLKQVSDDVGLLQYQTKTSFNAAMAHEMLDKKLPQLEAAKEELQKAEIAAADRDLASKLAQLEASAERHAQLRYEVK